ncbi:MAG: type II 3-dehydroquinate dehydratase [Actinobacteria bacterium]|jgi:3-dehydroquinate dehydratase II|uniref:3-dehydroquinate dehydratase n=1 Tax=freshwater metagenome TaxID=449393 RepID=A0A6J6JEB5_9ZZZZ|nr:type II 3-dehydroquinate dehydratase [Actinomycetota bacterium]
MKTVLVLNGPNLARLGSREPDIYGDMNLEALSDQLSKLADSLSVKVSFFQSDSESELMAQIHKATDAGQDIILNPAAFTHYSYALADACKAHTSSGAKLIEVHISNPHAREEFRHKSVISAAATGVIAGFGFDSYKLALRQLAG